MTHFPIIRTKRLTIKLKELSIGESIAISLLPPEEEQAEITAFLRAAVESEANGIDPLDWTVEERNLAVCSYLAAIDNDGPDFTVGENAHLSDYVDTSKDIESLNRQKICDFGGDTWHIRPLTGRMAESIERLKGEFCVNGVPAPTQFHWIVGAMAAQLVRENEVILDTYDSDGALDEWLLDRMNVFAAFPERDFSQLYLIYWQGREAQTHLFNVLFSKKGIIFAATEGVDNVPPARFPIDACVTSISKQFADRAE